MRSPRWSVEEDQLLLQECEKWKDNPIQWDKVSEALERRNPVQCQRRWYQLSPKKDRWKKWDTEETTRLESAVERYGRDWEKVSRAVGSDRTKERKRQWTWEFYIKLIWITECFRKWYKKRRQCPKIPRWSQDEDTSLVNAYYKHNGDWKLVASNIPKREADGKIKCLQSTVLANLKT